VGETTTTTTTTATTTTTTTTITTTTTTAHPAMPPPPPPPPPPPLLAFPNELFLQVFDYFAPAELAPVALVNRRLNILVAPQLYASYVADLGAPNSPPVATRVPARHTALVRKLLVWGEFPMSSVAAFARCPTSDIAWDLGHRVYDACLPTAARLSPAFMRRITTLELLLTRSHRGAMHRTGDGARMFHWFPGCLAHCSRLRKLVLTPTWHERPPLLIPSHAGIGAREQELVDEIDALFGATLEHLAFRWCPLYVLPDSRLHAAADVAFPALRILELRFSFGRGTEGLPSRKILYHAYRIALLRPQLRVRSLAIGPGGQHSTTTPFAPPLADLLELSSAEIAAFHAWLQRTFPAWRGSYHYSEHHAASVLPSLVAAVKALALAGVAYGLTHYIGHHVGDGHPYALGFCGNFAVLVAAAADYGDEHGLQALTLEAPPATIDAAGWVHSHLPQLPSLRALAITLRAAPDAETAALLHALRQCLPALGVRELRLHVDVDAGALALVLADLKLDRLEVAGMAFADPDGLTAFCDALAQMSSLREVRIAGGCVAGASDAAGDHCAPTRNAMGDAVLRAVPDGCKVWIETVRR